MAVRIRMKKMGRKHSPFYRICVMDSRNPRDGKAIEEVGTYDPMLTDKAARVKLNMERVDYWMSVGAQPSEKVGVLIKKIKSNKFGTAQAPPPMQAPKPLPEPEPEASAEEASEGEAAEASAEESTETKEESAE